MATGLFQSSSPRPARRGGSGGDRFKIRENSVRGESQDSGDKVYLKSCRCWSRACSTCSGVLGRRVQHRLLEGSVMWLHPRLLTLTVDRSKFESPQAAYEYVTEGRYVARLLSLLGVQRWVKVLEFQMETWDERGRGWPHWHMIIDKAGKRGYVDYKRAWSLWRDVWGIGGVDVTNQKKMEGRPTSDIIRYLCKYMVKYPSDGFPSWVLDKTNVRFLQASRSVGAIVGVRGEGGSEGSVSIVVPGANVEVKKNRKKIFSHTIRERVADCGASCSLFEKNGAGKEKYISRIPVRVGQVALAGKMGLIQGVEFETLTDGYGKKFLQIALQRFKWESTEEMEHRVSEGVSLLLQLEGSHINPTPYKQGVGCDSESASGGCASVPETLALWRRLIKRGRLYRGIGEVMEGAVAEPDDAYLLELIEAEESSTMPEK